MKLLKVLLVTLVICFASMGFVPLPPGNAKYKPAPKPHYTVEKGYGWDAEIPHDRPADVLTLMKIWKTEKGFSVFADMNKDGVCDAVLEFVLTGEFTEDGTPYVNRVSNSNCLLRDLEIKKFIKDNK